MQRRGGGNAIENRNVLYSEVQHSGVALIAVHYHLYGLLKIQINFVLKWLINKNLMLSVKLNNLV